MRARTHNIGVQAAVGRGNKSEHKHHCQTRAAVLHMLQHLMPVRLAAKNDGLVVVKRQDILRFFGILRRQQDPFQITNFGECFKPRTQVLEYAGPSMF